MECCNGNQTKWPQVIKHINWVDNHQMIIKMAHITSVVIEKMHFPIISMGALCCHGNQTNSQITIILAIFKSPYQSKILTKSGTSRINSFGGAIV